MKNLFGVMVLFYILIGVWVTQVYAFVKPHQTVHFEFAHPLHVNFTPQKKKQILNFSKGM